MPIQANAQFSCEYIAKQNNKTYLSKALKDMSICEKSLIGTYKQFTGAYGFYNDSVCSGVFVWARACVPSALTVCNRKKWELDEIRVCKNNRKRKAEFDQKHGELLKRIAVKNAARIANELKKKLDKKIKSELKKNAKKQMKKLIKTKTGINLNRQVTPVRLAVRLSNSITRKVKKYLKQVDARTQKQLHDVILKINRLGRRPTSIEKMNGRSSFAVARSKMNMTEKNYVKFKSCDLKKIDKKIHDFFLDTYFIIGAEKYGDIGVSYAQTIYAKVGYILYKSAANNCGVQVANKLNIYSSRYNKFIRRYKLLVNIKIRWAL